MNYLDQIAESVASGRDLGLGEMLTTGVFVAAVFGSVLFALAIGLMAACCWQTMAEARERDRAKNWLRRDATLPVAVVVPAEPVRTSGVERTAPAGHQERSWTFHVRHWTLVVSADRIEKPA